MGWHGRYKGIGERPKSDLLAEVPDRSVARDWVHVAHQIRPGHLRKQSRVESVEQHRSISVFSRQLPAEDLVGNRDRGGSRAGESLREQPGSNGCWVLIHRKDLRVAYHTHTLKAIRMGQNGADIEGEKESRGQDCPDVEHHPILGQGHPWRVFRSTKLTNLLKDYQYSINLLGEKQKQKAKGHTSVSSASINPPGDDSFRCPCARRASIFVIKPHGAPKVLSIERGCD